MTDEMLGSFGGCSEEERPKIGMGSSRATRCSVPLAEQFAAWPENHTREEGAIAFLDSGIGGLPYLSLTRSYLPDRCYVYVADSARFPYGGRSAPVIRDAVCDVVARLLSSHSIAAVVVACNTASVVALAALRNEFSIPFVGVVPAVKPAARASRRGRVGVLATSRTVGAAYLESLIETYARDCIVVRASGGELVQFVEELTPSVSKAERLRAVEDAVRPLLGESIDTLVLGCTHFTHLAEEFREVVGPGVAVIDSREGVARQVVRVVEEGLVASERLGASEAPEGPGPGAIRASRQATATMYVTGFPTATTAYRRHAERFGVAFLGTLPEGAEQSLTERSLTERRTE